MRTMLLLRSVYMCNRRKGTWINRMTDAIVSMVVPFKNIDQERDTFVSRRKKAALLLFTPYHWISKSMLGTFEKLVVIHNKRTKILTHSETLLWNELAFLSWVLISLDCCMQKGGSIRKGEEMTFLFFLGGADS